MVTLQRVIIPGISLPSHSCGGAIVTATYVLTAAHCINSFDSPRLELVAGKHDLDVVEPSEQRRFVEEIIIHPDYAGGFGVGPFDIGLIRVTEPYVFNTFVQAIALPVYNYIHYGDTVLFGWGNTSNTTVAVWPNLLHTVVKPIVAYEICESIYGGPGVGPLDPSNLCTGPLSGISDACGGDSGGPLVQNNAAGVVS